MPPGTQIGKTACFPFWKSGWFLRLLRLLPQTPANNSCSGQHRNFCGCAIGNRYRSAGKARRPAGRRACSLYAFGVNHPLHQTVPAAYPHGFQRSCQRALPGISVPMPFAFPPLDAVHRKDSLCQLGSSH